MRQLMIDEKEVTVPHVSLVAGNPSMKYSDQTDPLANGEAATCATLLHGGSASRNAFSNVVYAAPPQQQMQMQSLQCQSNFMMPQQQMVGIDDEFAQGLTEDQIKAGTIDDFFYYELQDVPISRKTPVALDFIDTFRSKYEDIYEIDSKKIAPGGEQRHSRDEADILLEVLHKVKFVNKAGAPLTTGPVSVMLARGGSGDGQLGGLKFMVQDTLKFTPFNSTASLNITSALNVRAQWKELPQVRQAEDHFVNPQEIRSSEDFVVLSLGDADVSRFHEAGRGKNQDYPDRDGMVWRFQRNETLCTLRLTSENVDPIRIKFEHTFEGFVKREMAPPVAAMATASAPTPTGPGALASPSGGFKLGGFDAHEVPLGASAVNPRKKLIIEGALEGQKRTKSLVFTVVHFDWTRAPAGSQHSFAAPQHVPQPQHTFGVQVARGPSAPRGAPVSRPNPGVPTQMSPRPFP